MLSWASYLFGGSQTEPQQDDTAAPQDTVPMETEAGTTGQQDSWVVVEHSDCCFGQIRSVHPGHVTCYPHISSHGNASDTSSQSTSDTPSYGASASDSSNSSPSKHSSPGSLSPVSHSRHLYICTPSHGRSSEAWLLTPPSCFTAGNNQVPNVDVTDLENLLIEHPSMSVYKRSGSTGEDSDISESSNNECVNTKSKRSHMCRQGPKRLHAISAKAEIIAQVSQVKHAQKLQQKRSKKAMNKKSLEKANKVSVSDKVTPRKSRARNPSGQMNGRVSQRK